MIVGHFGIGCRNLVAYDGIVYSKGLQLELIPECYEVWFPRRIYFYKVKASFVRPRAIKLYFRNPSL